MQCQSIGCVILRRQFRYCDIAHLHYPLPNRYLKVYLTDARDGSLLLLTSQSEEPFQLSMAHIQF